MASVSSRALLHEALCAGTASEREPDPEPAALDLLPGVDGALGKRRDLVDRPPAASCRVTAGIDRTLEHESARCCAAMLSLFGFGLLWDAHLRRGWAMKKNRLSGTLVGCVMLLLAVTGFGLYYFDGEPLRSVTEWLHWIVGGLSGAVFIWHLLAARRTRQIRLLHPSRPASDLPSVTQSART